MWKTLLKVVAFFAILMTLGLGWLAYLAYPYFYPIAYEVKLLESKKIVTIETEFRRSIGDSIKVAPFKDAPDKWYASSDVTPEFEGQLIYFKEIGVVIRKP